MFDLLPRIVSSSDLPEIRHETISSPLWLLLHASLGLVLVVLTMALLISAIVARKGGWIAVASIGFIGVLGAGFNGGSFLNYNQNFSSMLMSVGFILAMVTYNIGLVRGK